MYCTGRGLGVSDAHPIPILLIVYVMVMRKVPSQYIKQSPVRREVLHAEV